VNGFCSNRATHPYSLVRALPGVQEEDNGRDRHESSHGLFTGGRPFFVTEPSCRGMTDSRLWSATQPPSSIGPLDVNCSTDADPTCGIALAIDDLADYRRRCAPELWNMICPQFRL
jgi:hypothetical protein